MFMDPQLPTEVLQHLKRECLCRATQAQQLATYYNVQFPSPPILVVHGLLRTSKLRTTSFVLEARKIPYVVIKSKECLSQRHLLAKIFAACVHALGREDDLDRYDKVESLNALLGNLRRLFEQKDDGKEQQPRFVLVIEGADKQRGATPTLLPALARLGDIVPSLSVIIISTSPRPLQLSRTGVPYVYFPPYTRQEAITLLTTLPPVDLIPPEPICQAFSERPTTDIRPIYYQFISTVYDSLIGPTSSISIDRYRDACKILWPRFLWPLLSHEPPPGKARTWDFARLLVRNRTLFQANGEAILTNTLTPQTTAWTFEALLEEHHKSKSIPTISDARTITAPAITSSCSPHKTNHRPMLAHFPALLLLASYLSSHTHPKHDQILFSRLSHTSKKASRIRKGPSTPRKKLFASTSTSTTTPNTVAQPSPAKSRASKTLFDVKSGVPRPFTLERLIAVVRAVHPDGVGRERGIADKVYVGLAELERLRLVVRVGDEDDEKWRVNVPREWVVKVLEDWQLGLAGYELDDR